MLPFETSFFSVPAGLRGTIHEMASTSSRVNLPILFRHQRQLEVCIGDPSIMGDHGLENLACLVSQAQLFVEQAERELKIKIVFVDSR